MNYGAKSSLLIGLLLLSGASLTACKASEGDVLEANQAAPLSGASEEHFGKEFARSIRADPNSTPVNVTANSLPPVSYTTEPVSID